MQVFCSFAAFPWGRDVLLLQGGVHFRVRAPDSRRVEVVIEPGQEKTGAAADITVLEIMSVADFPGRFGWGYDGADPIAPTRLYGAPADFRHFVDQARRAGLSVILDLVYNHMGQDGSFPKRLAKDYFTDRYENKWE